MNKTVPWSITSVGPDTREAAREAARLSGLPLGEWLESVFASRAAKLGVPAAEIGDHEKLEAVVQELSRLASTAPKSANDPDGAASSFGADRAGDPVPPQADEGTSGDSLEPASEPVRKEFNVGGSAPLAPEQIPTGGREFAPSVVPSLQARSLDSRIRGAIHGSLAEAIDFEDEEDPRPTQKAMRALSEKLAKFERQNWLEAMGEGLGPAAPSKPDAVSRPGRPATSDAKLAKDHLIRDAVAEITRRQAALDADHWMPADRNLAMSATLPQPALASVGPGAGLPPQKQGAGVGLGDLNDAVSALEARLAAGPRTTGEASQNSEAGGRNRLKAFEDRVGPRREIRDGAAFVPADQAEGSDRSQPAQLSSGRNNTLDEIRTLLDQFEPGSTISSLERRMEDLAAKIDRGMEPHSSSKQIEDLARQIDGIHASLQGQAGAPVIEPSSVDALVRGIADRIEAAREASADIYRLEGLIKGLADKIDEGDTQPDQAAFGALGAQMSRLEDRLERSEASLSALDGVERSLGVLVSQIGEAQHATIGAAETAGRTAAHETLHAALQNSASGTGIAIGGVGILDQVTHELAELRGLQDASSRRTHSTLLDIHQTMERLVEVLAGANNSAGLSTGLHSALGGGGATPSGSEAQTLAEGAPVVRADASRSPEDGPEADRGSAEVIIDPIDSLIEPGLGRASVRERALKVEPGAQALAKLSAAVAVPSGEHEGPASFIAAARRAAQAAQTSAMAAQRPAGRVKVSPETSALSSLERARNFLVQRRRPLLLSLAGLVLLLGALEVAKLGLSETMVSEKTGAIESLEPQPAEVAAQGNVTDAQPAKVAVQADPADAKVAATNVTPDKTLPKSGAAAGDASVGAAPAPPSVASAVAPGPASIPAPEPKGPASAGAATPGASASAPGPKGAATAGPTSTGALARNTNPFLAMAGVNANGLGEGLKSMALAGDPAAQYEVGLRFSEGRTVNRDVKAAAAWFQKAAAQGFAPAQYRLGSAFEKGIGEPRDPAQAISWYARAAEAGNMRAMHNLAVMAAEGSVGKPDYAKAATWFAKAAVLGVRDSQFNLAILCARGLGVEQSLAKSYTWFAIAAAQGDEDAAKKRDEVGARLNAAALSAAKSEAESFRPNTAVSAANEVTPPPGGWDAAAPARSVPSAAKGAAPKVSVM